MAVVFIAVCIVAGLVWLVRQAIEELTHRRDRDSATRRSDHDESIRAVGGRQVPSEWTRLDDHQLARFMESGEPQG
jgi:hypothetical protein